jgi:hypothetical protein
VRPAINAPGLQSRRRRSETYVHAAALPDSVDKQQHLHTAALVTEPKTQASRKSISPNCLLFDFILRLSTWPASSLRLPTQGSGKHGISTDDARSLSHRLATASITQHPHPLLHLHAPRTIHRRPRRKTTCPALQTARVCPRAGPAVGHFDGVRLRDRKYHGSLRSPGSGDRLRKRGGHENDRQERPR